MQKNKFNKNYGLLVLVILSLLLVGKVTLAEDINPGELKGEFRNKIGEIRDDITRSRAVKARTTGHLVFTTIHANSTRGIKERLEYLKVDKRDLFMENISVALHQELVKEEGVEGLNLCYEFMLGGKQIFSNIKLAILAATENASSDLISFFVSLLFIILVINFIIL